MEQLQSLRLQPSTYDTHAAVDGDLRETIEALIGEELHRQTMLSYSDTQRHAVVPSLREMIREELAFILSTVRINMTPGVVLCKPKLQRYLYALRPPWCHTSQCHRSRWRVTTSVWLQYHRIAHRLLGTHPAPLATTAGSEATYLASAGDGCRMRGKPTLHSEGICAITTIARQRTHHK